VVAGAADSAGLEGALHVGSLADRAIRRACMKAPAPRSVNAARGPSSPTRNRRVRSCIAARRFDMSRPSYSSSPLERSDAPL
jgi:hypothetical protein